eukprot:CAMPEP_0202848770 /NCGR_PEP_ID=MMETSP1389-20130828/78983_1 /ASSEMBLY_ACC=CAM_ASM_000865 /TAXON_ID=302021 /ORGANISM="Rhodomonas sp., Strain CCMP768" /LENGTH=49 /DNA_ID= /DNA_START= /DNA_END= /DNA_ORIENTATION=
MTPSFSTSQSNPIATVLSSRTPRRNILSVSASSGTESVPAAQEAAQLNV